MQTKASLLVTGLAMALRSARVARIGGFLLPFGVLAACAAPPSHAPVVAQTTLPTPKPPSSATAPDPSIEDVQSALGNREPEPLVKLAAKNLREPVLAAQAHLDEDTRLAAFAALPREGISYSTTAPGALVNSIARIYEGLALLEPVALGEGARSADAICRIDDVLMAAARARAFARMAEDASTPPAVRAVLDSHLPWLGRAEEMRKRYLAKSLRTKAPGRGCFLGAATEGLLLVAKSPEAKKKLVSKFDEQLAREGEKLRVSDMLDLAALHLEVDDPVGAESWLTKGKERLARATSPDDASRVRRLEKDLETTKKLVALPLTDGLARADLLLGLNRREDARALLEAFEPTPPRSLKTASRLSLVTFQEVASRDTLTKALAAAATEVRNGRDGEHDEVVADVALGLEGARIVEAMGNGTLVRELLTSRPRLVTLTDDLARWNPARAAAVRIFVDVLGMCEKALVAGDIGCLLATLPELLPRAAAMKRSYPNEIDVDRAVLFFTMFAKDRALALETLTAPPSEAARESRELTLDRARSSATLASVLSSPTEIGRLRRSLDAIVPQSSDPHVADPEKAALQADFDLIEALLAKGPAQTEALRAAGRSYTKALDALGHRDDASRARLVNALATLALREGRRADAKAMLDAYVGPRDWPFEITHLVATGVTAKNQDAVRAMGKDGGQASTTTLELWRASLLIDKKEALAAEAAALKESRSPGYLMKGDAAKRGIEWSGRMNLSLGLNAHGHSFAASAFADLWFLPQPRVHLGELEKRSQATQSKK